MYAVGKTAPVPAALGGAICAKRPCIRNQVNKITDVTCIDCSDSSITKAITVPQRKLELTELDAQLNYRKNFC